VSTTIANYSFDLISITGLGELGDIRISTNGLRSLLTISFIDSKNAGGCNFIVTSHQA